MCWKRLCVLYLALSFALTTDTTAEQIDTAAGRQFAEQRCGRCHAVGVRGDSPQQGLIPFRRLHDRYPIDMLTEALTTGTIGGHDEMPMFDIGLATARNLVAYIDSLDDRGPRYLPR